MGRHFNLAHLLPQYSEEVRKTKQRIVKESQPQYHPIAGAFIGFAVVSLFVVSLYQVNSSSTSGYQITHVKNEIAAQQDQYQKLEVQAAQLQSIQRVESDPAVVGMVPVDATSYIQTNAVAVR